MKIKDKYIKFKKDGVLYDFTNYSSDRLKLLWEKNIDMRYIFEEKQIDKNEKKKIYKEKDKSSESSDLAGSNE